MGYMNSNTTFGAGTLVPLFGCLDGVKTPAPFVIDGTKVPTPERQQNEAEVLTSFIHSKNGTKVPTPINLFNQGEI